MDELKTAIVSIPNNIVVDKIHEDVIFLRLYLGGSIVDGVNSAFGWFFIQKYFKVANLLGMNGHDVTFTKRD